MVTDQAYGAVPFWLASVAEYARPTVPLARVVVVIVKAGRLVNENAAWPVAPGAVAVTEYVPAIAFAVNASAVATPEALDCTVAVMPPPANVPPAPVSGAVNVTLTFDTGLPLASLTLTTNGPKAALARADWPLPELTVTELTVPVVFVKLNVIGATEPTASSYQIASGNAIGREGRRDRYSRWVGSDAAG